MTRIQSTSTDPRIENRSQFMLLGRRLSTAFNQLDRANIQQIILDGLEKLAKDAEAYAKAAAGKREKRQQSRVKQLQRLKK